MDTFQSRLKSLSPKERGCNPDHHGYMLNPRRERLLCMWADCTSPGLNKFHVDLISGGTDVQITHLIFCSPFHRSLYINSHRELGHVAPGAEKQGRFW